MDEDGKNPLARFEKRGTNYLLIALSAALAVLLVVGIAASINARDWTAALIFFVSGALFAVLVLANITAARRLGVADETRLIHWDGEAPDVQRQNVNVEVLELALHLQADDEQIPELLSAYIVAEDLALRQIQQEENLPLIRHVSIGQTPFDGVLVDQDLITCIEVSFVVVPDMRQDKVEAILKKIDRARKNLAELKSRLRLRLMVVLVTQLDADEEDLLRQVLVRRRFKDMQIENVEIRLLDFEMLQKVYVSE